MRFRAWGGVLLALVGCAWGAERNLGLAGADAGSRRVALIIGNSKYAGMALRNPVNDARDVARTLRRLGFEVIEKTDVTQKEMNRAITQFGGKLGPDAMALFYYAGHGIQAKGKNYLIPIDAQIVTEASVRSETVDVDAILEQLSVSPLNVVILDACRNNPFERRFRGAGGGLAQMDAPKGTLIAYATAPGKVASDGEGRNGLYTQELLKLLQTPGLPVEAVFKRVRANVARATGDSQIPWEASSLTGDFFFAPDAGVKPVDAEAPLPPKAGLRDLELAYWKSIMESADAEDFNEFLRRYPDSDLAPAANSKLRQLAARQHAAVEEARQRAAREEVKLRAVASGPCPGGFAGKWQTNYGWMEIQVEGSRARGTYETGTVDGDLSGRTLKGNWTETGSLIFVGTGNWQIELSPDGRRFSGTWTRATGFGNSQGAWTGECLQ